VQILHNPCIIPHSRKPKGLMLNESGRFKVK
jgi:hypothetical protein